MYKLMSLLTLTLSLLLTPASAGGPLPANALTPGALRILECYEVKAPDCRKMLTFPTRIKMPRYRAEVAKAIRHSWQQAEAAMFQGLVKHSRAIENFDKVAPNWIKQQRKERQAWGAYRDAHCAQDAQLPYARDITPEIEWTTTCEIKMTDIRIKNLMATIDTLKRIKVLGRYGPIAQARSKSQ